MSTLKDIIKESLTNFDNSIKETYTKKNDIIDSLDSTDSTKPLSANMGNTLNNSISTLNSTVSNHTTQIDTLNSNMRNTIIKNKDIWCSTKRTFEITGLTAFSFIIIHVADDGTHGYKRGGLYFCSKNYILQQGTLTGSSCDVNEDLSKIILSGELGMCFSLYLSNANIIVTEV